MKSSFEFVGPIWPYKNVTPQFHFKNPVAPGWSSMDPQGSPDVPLKTYFSAYDGAIWSTIIFMVIVSGVWEFQIGTRRGYFLDTRIYVYYKHLSSESPPVINNH